MAESFEGHDAGRATPNYDLNINVGVPGWRLDGRMVRLRDVVAATGDRSYIEEHRRALVLAEICTAKLRNELAEAEA